MVSDVNDFPPDTVQQYAIDKDEEEQIGEDEVEQVDEDDASSIPPVAAKKSKLSAAVGKMASGGRKRKPSQKAKEAAVGIALEGGKRRKSETTATAAYRITTAFRSPAATASSALPKSAMAAIPRKK
jgi:hypothetical protein